MGNRNIIIAVVVVVVLCCCLMIGSVAAWWLWNNGDGLVGTTSRVLPALLAL